MSGFAKEWWDSRPSGRWWWRTFSLLVLLALAGVICAARAQGSKNLAERYRWSASQAIQSRDWNAADLWLKKLATLEPPSQNLEFVTALVSAERNEMEPARRVMERLIQTQYTDIRGAVGLWMAHDVLRKPEALNREGLNLARDLLVVARRNSETSNGENLIAEIALASGFTPEAVQILAEATPNIDELRLKLAERFVGLTGDDDGTAPSTTPLPTAGTVDYYLRLAESHVLLEAWTDAEQVLLKGLQEQNEPRLKRALAELYVAMSLALEEEGRVPLPESIRLVQLGYSLAPDNPLVLDRLAMLLRTGPNYPPGVQDRLSTHIRARLDSAPDSKSWRTALILLQILRGVEDLGTDCPPEFLDQNPEARLLIAKLYRQRGNLERCQAHAQVAASKFREKLVSTPNNNSARIALSESLVLLDRWRDAIEVLTIGGVSPHAEELRIALSNIYLDWAAHNPDTAEKVNHLLSAWQSSPGQPMITIRLLELTRLPSELSQVVLLKLQESLDKNQSASLASLVLGSAAAARQDYATARLQLEAAARDLPNDPILLNNLAWVLVRGNERDPKRALKLVNRAMSLAPSTPELRETRGHVYFELKQWPQVISDLKTVAPMFPERSELHVMLSKAYQEMQQPELSFRHRQLATQASPRRPVSADSKPPALPALPDGDPPADALRAESADL